MSLDTDLQSKLFALVGVPVQQNYTNESDGEPRVWYKRHTDTSEVDLSGSGLLREVTYSIEVNSLDPDVGATIADKIQQALNGYHGVMQGTMVLGCFAANASDDYIFRNLNIDSGFHTYAFELHFIVGA